MRYGGCQVTIEAMGAMLTCGIVDHDETCLCDVVVNTTTPVHFGFHQVWHAPKILRALGYSGAEELADDPEKFATFLEALAYGFGVCRGEIEVTDRGLLLRQITSLLQTGESIVDVPALLHLDFETVVDCLANQRPAPYRAWPERTWGEWEDALDAVDERTTLNVLGRQFGIAGATVRLLASKFRGDHIFAHRNGVHANVPKLNGLAS